MAEQMPLKRPREETQSSDEETKRHKSYNHILSLLEAEEDEPNQDLSSLLTTLQQELSSDSVLDDPLPYPTSAASGADQENPRPNTTAEATNTDTDTDTDTITITITGSLEDEDVQDDKEQVIRHLLEASDDELGIPSREDGVDVGVFESEQGCNNGGNGLALCDRLWELEDEAANYYILLQSELFL